MIEVKNIALKPRLVWVDIARGLAVLLVVVHHTIPMLTADFGIFPTRLMDVFDQFLMLMRMPVLCFVSGLFISKTNKLDGKSFWTSRVAYFIYLYLLWSTVYILFQLVQGVISPSASSYTEALSWIDQTLRIHAFLWYFFALGAFYAFYRLSRNIPVKYVLPFLVLLSILSGLNYIEFNSWGWNHIFQYLVYFMLGAWGSDKLAQKINSLNSISFLIISLILGSLFAFYYFNGYPEYFYIAETTLAPLGVLWISNSAVLIARIRAISGTLIFVGKRTIAVYALHGVVLRTMFFLAGALGLSSIAQEQSPWVLLIIFSTVASIFSLLIWKITKAKLPWLYARPKFLNR